MSAESITIAVLVAIFCVYLIAHISLILSGNVRGTSLRDLHYPTHEELKDVGIDPKDFYYFIRFGVPIPGRGNASRPSA